MKVVNSIWSVLVVEFLFDWSDYVCLGIYYFNFFIIQDIN